MSRFLSVEVSAEFDSIRHLVRLQDFPDEFQHTNDLAHGAVLLEAIDNSRVSGSLVVQSEEIGVVGEDDVFIKMELDCPGHSSLPACP